MWDATYYEFNAEAQGSEPGVAMVVRRSTCGIAMCTCNGVAYLDAQLRSLVEQTRLPERIAISDDRSDDGTWDRLNVWAGEVRSAHGIDVILLRNETRLGVTRNFEQAIKALDTEIIFLADQDDVWAKNKIEVLADCLETDSHALLVHSDAYLIGDRDEDLGRSLFESLYLTAADRELASQQRFFEVYCRRNLVTGTTAAFRRELLELALPFPVNWIHDEWLAACAAAWQHVTMLPQKLTFYRQHGRNAIGVPSGRLSRLAKYAQRVLATPRDVYLAGKISRLGALHQRLEAAGVASSETIELLTQAERHFLRRKAFSRRLPLRMMSIIRESRTRGYIRFADGAAGMLRDLIHL
ncbi:glycosyltransferase family 2 protein [Paraburkholderia sp. BCC1884]|uniref:glycosyltransferase family 2 protein n=1 Tax=Paraburkholderia sp. BCC1884 TaxID=2562668 RepID=UPI0021B19E65|nr:glycosyltransferase family 2 protein [Paraburkholderia sp. BCC1884]